MAEITKPIILDDTGKSIATANARTAAALESIAQILADGGEGGGEGGGSGADGFSPIARVVQTPTGATITITDKTGTTTAEIANGAKGDTGATGPQGPKGDTGEKGADGTMTFADLTEEQKASLKGDKGDTGATGPQGPKGDKGDTGPAGSDAAVTSANIASALGYTPANPADIPVVTNDFTNAYKDRVDTLWGDYQSAVVALG